jgi:DNA-directed RNA polymerase specialized sigma24 family protein
VAKKTNQKQNAEPAKEPSLAGEISRMTRVLAMFVLKDIEEEGRRVAILRGVGYSVRDIAEILNKTEGSVQKAIERSRGRS